MIKQENGKYVVYSESGKKFGTYDSEAKAKRRLAQMEMFKHMKKTASEVVDLSDRTSVFAPQPKCKVHGSGYKCEDLVDYSHSSYQKSKSSNFKKKAEYVFAKLAQGEPKLKSIFAPEPSCKVLGSGKNCAFGKAPNFAKLAAINFSTLMPSLNKLHKNLRGTVVDIISRSSQLTSLANKNPDRAVTKAVEMLGRKNPNKVKLIYTPQGHQSTRGIGAGKYGEYNPVLEKLSQLEGTARGAKILYDFVGKQILKSYAKHGEKAFKGLRGFKNTEILGGVRNLLAMPQPKNQQMIRNMWKDTKLNIKKFLKNE